MLCRICFVFAHMLECGDVELFLQVTVFLCTFLLQTNLPCILSDTCSERDNNRDGGVLINFSI